MSDRNAVIGEAPIDFIQQPDGSSRAGCHLPTLFELGL